MNSNTITDEIGNEEEFTFYLIDWNLLLILWNQRRRSFLNSIVLANHWCHCACGHTVNISGLWRFSHKLPWDHSTWSPLLPLGKARRRLPTYLYSDHPHRFDAIRGRPKGGRRWYLQSDWRDINQSRFAFQWQSSSTVMRSLAFPLSPPPPTISRRSVPPYPFRLLPWYQKQWYGCKSSARREHQTNHCDWAGDRDGDIAPWIAVRRFTWPTPQTMVHKLYSSCSQWIWPGVYPVFTECVRLHERFGME